MLAGSTESLVCLLVGGSWEVGVDGEETSDSMADDLVTVLECLATTAQGPPTQPD